MIIPMVVMMAGMQTGRIETPPVCEIVTVQENPAFPNPQFSYKIKLCGNKALPIHSITVDGAAFPEKSVAYKVVTFWAK